MCLAVFWCVFGVSCCVFVCLSCVSVCWCVLVRVYNGLGVLLLDYMWFGVSCLGVFGRV